MNTRSRFAAVVLLLAALVVAIQPACRPAQQTAPAGLTGSMRNPSKPAGVDAFGDPAPAGAIARIGTVRLRDVNGFDQLLFSSDKQSLASVTSNGHVVTVWNVATGRKKFSANARCAAFSPDGRFLAVGMGGYNNEVRLLDPRSGNVLHAFTRPDATMSLSFSPDSRRLAGTTGGGYPTHGADKTPQGTWICSIPDGKQLAMIDYRCDQVLFSPNGNMVGMRLRQSGYRHLWNVPTNGEADSYALLLQEPATTQPSGDRYLDPEIVAFGEKSRTFFTSGPGQVLREWNVADLKPLGATSLPMESGVSCACSAGAARIAYADMDGHAVVWDRATRKEIIRLPARNGRRDWRSSFTVGISSDGTLLAWAAALHSIAIYDIQAGRRIDMQDVPFGGIEALAFAPDGKALAIGDGTDHIFLADPLTGKLRTSTSMPALSAQSLDYSPDGATLACGGYSDFLTLLSATPSCLRVKSQLKSPTTQGDWMVGADVVRFARDRQSLVAGDNHSGFFATWASGDRAEVVHREVHAWGNQPVVSPTGRFVAVTERQSGISVWANGASRFSCEYYFRDTSRDMFNGKVTIYDTRTGRAIGRPIATNCAIQSVAFSLDERLLAVGGYIEPPPKFNDLGRGMTINRETSLPVLPRVGIWDLSARRQIADLQTSPFTALLFAPDGKHLALVCPQLDDPDQTTVVPSYDAVEFWNVGTCRKVAAVPGQREISTFTFSPDGRLLAMGGSDSTVLVWDWQVEVARQAAHLPPTSAPDLSEVAVVVTTFDLTKGHELNPAMDLWESKMKLPATQPGQQPGDRGDLVDPLEVSFSKLCRVKVDRDMPNGTVLRWHVDKAKALKAALPGGGVIEVQPVRLGDSATGLTRWLYRPPAGPPIVLGNTLQSMAEVRRLEASPEGRYLAVVSCGEGAFELEVFDLAPLLFRKIVSRLAAVSPFPGHVSVKGWRGERLLMSSDSLLTQRDKDGRVPPPLTLMSKSLEFLLDPASETIQAISPEAKDPAAILRLVDPSDREAARELLKNTSIPANEPKSKPSPATQADDASVPLPTCYMPLEELAPKSQGILVATLRSVGGCDMGPPGATDYDSRWTVVKAFRGDYAGNEQMSFRVQTIPEKNRERMPTVGKTYILLMYPAGTSHNQIAHILEATGVKLAEIQKLSRAEGDVWRLAPPEVKVVPPAGPATQGEDWFSTPAGRIVNRRELAAAIADLDQADKRMTALAKLVTLAAPVLGTPGGLIMLSGDAEHGAMAREAAAAAGRCRDVETISKALDSSDRWLQWYAIMFFDPENKPQEAWAALLPKLKRLAIEDGPWKDQAVDRLRGFPGGDEFVRERINLETDPYALMRLAYQPGQVNWQPAFCVQLIRLLNSADAKIRGRALGFISGTWVNAPMWQVQFDAAVVGRVARLTLSGEPGEAALASNAMKALTQIDRPAPANDWPAWWQTNKDRWLAGDLPRWSQPPNPLRARLRATHQLAANRPLQVDIELRSDSKDPFVADLGQLVFTEWTLTDSSGKRMAVAYRTPQWTPEWVTFKPGQTISRKESPLGDSGPMSPGGIASDRPVRLELGGMTWQLAPGTYTLQGAVAIGARAGGPPAPKDIACWTGQLLTPPVTFEVLAGLAPATTRPDASPATQAEDQLRARLAGAMPKTWQLRQITHGKVAPTHWPDGQGWQILLERKGTPSDDYIRGLGGEVGIWIMDDSYKAKTAIEGSERAQQPPAQEAERWRGRRVFVWGEGGEDWKDWRANVQQALKATDAPATPPASPATQAEAAGDELPDGNLGLEFFYEDPDFQGEPIDQLLSYVLGDKQKSGRASGVYGQGRALTTLLFRLVCYPVARSNELLQQPADYKERYIKLLDALVERVGKLHGNESGDDLWPVRFLGVAQARGRLARLLAERPNPLDNVGQAMIAQLGECGDQRDVPLLIGLAARETKTSAGVVNKAISRAMVAPPLPLKADGTTDAAAWQAWWNWRPGPELLTRSEVAARLSVSIREGQSFRFAVRGLEFHPQAAAAIVLVTAEQEWTMGDISGGPKQRFMMPTAWRFVRYVELKDIWLAASGAATIADPRTGGAVNVPTLGNKEHTHSIIALSPAMKAKMEKSLAIRKQFPQGGLAMSQQLGDLVEPGMSVNEVKFLLAPAGAGSQTLMGTGGSWAASWTVEPGVSAAVNNSWQAVDRRLPQDAWPVSGKAMIRSVPDAATTQPGGAGSAKPTSPDSPATQAAEMQATIQGLASRISDKAWQVHEGAIRETAALVTSQPEDTDMAVFQPLVVSLFAHANWGGIGEKESRLATDALVCIGQPAVPTLVAKLKSADSHDRWSAMAILERIGEPKALVLASARSLLKDADYYVRRVAIDALGKLGKAALPAVHDLESQDAVERELTNRQNMRDEYEPAQVRIGLALIRIQGASPERIAGLARHLSSEDKSAVASYAASVLGELGAAARAASPQLRAALRHESAQVRINAAAALGKVGADDEATIDALIDRVKNDPEVYVRGAASGSLRQIAPNDKAALRAVAEHALLDSAGPRIPTTRPTAPAAPASPATQAEGAGRMERIETILQKMTSKDDRVRNQASMALVELGGRDLKGSLPAEIAPRLIEQLRAEKELGNRGNIAWALGQVGSTASPAIPDLIACFKETDRWSSGQLAMNVAYALKGIGAASVQPLIEALKDRNDRVRERAAMALGVVGPVAKAAVPALKQAVDDTEKRVGVAAALSLAQIDPAGPAGLDALIRFLKDPNAFSRGMSANALTHLGPAAKDATSSLIELLEDNRVQPYESANARATAAFALGLIGPDSDVGDSCGLARGVTASRAACDFELPESGVRSRHVC